RIYVVCCGEFYVQSLHLNRIGQKIATFLIPFNGMPMKGVGHLMRTLQLRPERTVILMGALWCCMVFAYAATQYYSRHIAPAKIERLESAGYKRHAVHKY